MSSIETLYIAFFTTGFFVGFGHCMGMCGPIVVSFSLNLRAKGVMAPNLLYHAGRITTYAVLGGVMGASGAFTRITAGIGGLQKGVMIFAGLMIIVMGLGMTGWVPLGRIFGDYCNPEGVIRRGFRKLSGIQSTAAFLPLGMLLGLLPCGPVYTALVAAARAGMEIQNSFKAVLAGMGLMAVFGIGTIPALLMVARLTGMGWLRSRDMIYKIGSVLMIAVGIYFVVQGIRF
ncbi:MAG: sulfite exporter TauE/SafE family protein [Deltaproteobacteria bacterium]|jgi:sulfite exporter TauE/SafE|nr:sulfite exporter TauE/SafE family protein [Deltaproteobacteria bacterium]